MLIELSIRNLAIIDDLQIRFAEGFSILSGETGAGKSIIINAINLLLGGRAAADQIRTGCESAEIEALFDISTDNLINQVLTDHGYECSEELLVKRILSQTNRHRCYINGRIASTGLLRQVTENLAAISGQHANQKLMDHHEHLLILDQYAGLMPLREQVSAAYRSILPLIRQLSDEESLSRRQQEQIEDYKRIQEEILVAGITIGEDQLLEQEVIRLRHAETLYQLVHESVRVLYGERDAVIVKVVELRKQLDKIVQIDPELGTFSGKLENITYQLEDCVESFRDYQNKISLDGRRLEEVEERINLLKRLKRKFGGSLESVKEHLRQAEQGLEEVENIASRIEQTKALLSEQHRKLGVLAQELSQRRLSAAQSLSAKVEAELAGLRMENTCFAVKVSASPAIDGKHPYLTINGCEIMETGIDRAEFMISPNIGEELKPLSNIASGGELSRIVLALKVIQANTGSTETLIFDEVDAGIGGGVAEAAGKKIAAISRYHQIICITHLPQIAQFADAHFKIAKHIEDERTYTTICRLTEQDRVDEIARMLGGVEITQITLNHAKEMIARAAQYKSNLLH